MAVLNPVKPVEVEVIGSPNAGRVYFKPIGRSLRGLADFGRATSDTARSLHKVWPEPIPGKVIGISETGEKYIRDPLADREHAKVRQRIIGRNLVVEDQPEKYESESILTWTYWLRRMVDSGLGRIVKGELPPLSELEPPRKGRDESRPRKSFILDEPDNSRRDRLAVAIEQLAENTAAQTAMLAKLAERLK